MAGLKPIAWVGAGKRDLLEFPEEVVHDVGYNLYEAQLGRMPRNAKVPSGYGGANVREIVSDFNTDTYCAVYITEFQEAIYVLHCFQKKSKHGGDTPRQEIEAIDRKLSVACEEHKRWQREQPKNKKNRP